MEWSDNIPRVLVTGGGTFLGDNIASALLAEGADVTLLVREGVENRLGPLRQRVRWFVADIWDPSSLRGRARGHQVVIHTVGSMVAEPSKGLTHHRLNFVSARNVTNMCVSDGVAFMILLSSPSAPWISRAYIAAKREAEVYLRRVGMRSTVIRAPLTYVRGRPRPLFYRLMTLLGSIPLVASLGFGRIAPMPVDILARGVARIALQDMERPKKIYFASDLRRRNTAEERRGYSTLRTQDFSLSSKPVQHPIELLGEDVPFGWMPDNRQR